MSEIEKMKQYIGRAPMKKADNYCLAYGEVVELIGATRGTDALLDIITLAFDYGKAKGYRAAKAKVRA